MKSLCVVAGLVFALMLVGCADDNSLGPIQAQDPGAGQSEGLQGTNCLPPLFFSFSSPDPNLGFVTLEQIDTRTGKGTYFWTIGADPDPEFGGLPCPFGLTFDRDGSIYTIVNWLDFVREHAKSQLARVNPVTGAVKYIGKPYAMHFAGPEMDANGNIYATGFTEGPPETDGLPELIFGDSYLYRIDKRTGVATRVGNTGRADWMDLAFDSKGKLWATTMNMLYQLDTKTGKAKFITEIIGVPSTNIPDMPPEDWQYMEVMTIAFDDNDVLWATGIKGFVTYLGNAPVMRIDVKTGKATLVGYTGKGYNHGGDILSFRAPSWHSMANDD